MVQLALCFTVHNKVARLAIFTFATVEWNFHKIFSLFVFFDGLHVTVNERSHVGSVEIDLGLLAKFCMCLDSQEHY